MGIRLADHSGVSGAGAVDMYRHASDGTWSFYERLIGFVPQDQQHFGHAVALSGTELIVGVETDNFDGLFRSGYVAHFQFDGSNWQSVYGFGGTTARDYMGRSVGVDATGGNGIAGAINADPAGSASGEATICT